MDLSVQYTLREPFFISSRLMPAIRVGDTAIHMRADSVDSEDGDHFVRWQYIIDGDRADYEAADVTTPYLGWSTIAGQLPTAMSTLLTFLSHDADLGEAGPFPDDVQRWARRHQDEIEMALDSIDNPDPPTMSSSQLWRAITHDPYQTPHGRWCAGQAVAHADRLATLNPPAPDSASAKTGLTVRDEAWHDTALAWYTMLTNQPEPVHEPVPVCAVADRDTIEAWLRQPFPGSSAGTIGQALGLDHLDYQEDGSRTLQALIEHAQRDGLFGIPNHTIRVHTVVDHVTGSDASLLTIHTPSGATLAAGPIATDVLTTGVTGRGDEVTVLRNCAAAVQNAFAAHHGTLPADRARPFPRLGTEPSVTAITSTVPGAAVTTAHRHR